MDIPCFDGPDPPAVGADVGHLPQLPAGDRLPYLPPDAAGGDTGDGAVLDVLYNRVMGVPQGAGADGNIPNPQGGDGLHHHVHHIVPVPQVVVEGDGHSIPQAAFLNRLGEGSHHLVPPRSHLCPHSGAGLPVGVAIPVKLPLEGLLPLCKELVRDLPSHMINHFKSPLR